VKARPAIINGPSAASAAKCFAHCEALAGHETPPMAISQREVAAFHPPASPPCTPPLAFPMIGDAAKLPHESTIRMRPFASSAAARPESPSPGELRSTPLRMFFLGKWRRNRDARRSRPEPRPRPAARQPEPLEENRRRQVRRSTSVWAGARCRSMTSISRPARGCRRADGR